MKAQDEAQDAVRAGVLGAQVEDELLREELILDALRRLQLGVGLQLEGLATPLRDVGPQLRYPPFAIFSRSFRMPSTRASGRGGQPGT